MHRFMTTIFMTIIPQSMSVVQEKSMVRFRAGDKVGLWHCVGRLPAYWFKSQSEAKHQNGQDSERTMATTTNAVLYRQRL